jgi:hypothetical protein
MELPAIDSFPARSRLTIRPWPTKRSCQISRVSNAQIDNRFDWAFFRLLTPTLEVGIDGAWVHRNWGNSLRSGFDVTSLSIKELAYRNDLHEILVSAGLSWGIGHSGAQGVGANAPDLLQPGIFFGKGFGDLPDGLAWLRPFAITGAVTLEHPMLGSSINFGIDPQTGQLGPALTRNVDTRIGVSRSNLARSI